MDPFGNPSDSSSQSPPKADITDTHLALDAQETAQGHSEPQHPPQPSPPPRYYTRAASRRLPPPSADQTRAGKLLINTIDRRPHLSPTSQHTILKQTTTSMVKPPVPPAQQSSSGIVPLGPPPPRQPGGPSSSSSSPSSPPMSPPPAVGRFDHLPPPSLSYDDAWKIMKDFVDGLEKVKDGVSDSELKDLILSLQMDLGLPPEARLFEVYRSTDSLEEVINYVMDYFETSEVPSADD